MILFYKYLYHSFAFAYNPIARIVSGGDWFDWCKEIQQFVTPGERVLEVGFGTGVLQLSLAERGFFSIGIDESMQMARITKKKLTQKQKNPKLARANVKSIPIKSSSFNVILSTFPSEYVFDKDFHSEINRVLYPDGRFICLIGIEFNRKNLIDIFYRRLYRLTGFNLSAQRKSDMNPIYPGLLENSLVERISIAGRTLIFIEYINFTR